MRVLNKSSPITRPDPKLPNESFIENEGEEQGRPTPWSGPLLPIVTARHSIILIPTQKHGGRSLPPSLSRSLVLEGVYFVLRYYGHSRNKGGAVLGKGVWGGGGGRG